MKTSISKNKVKQSLIPMQNNCSHQPIQATSVSFVAYVFTAEYEYQPDPNTPPKVIQKYRYRYENPNPFIARRSAIQAIRRIKSNLDKGLACSNKPYQYESIKLWLEYQVEHPCENSKPEIRKLCLLDGEIGTFEEIQNRLESEEFLLDKMGFSFVRADIDTEKVLDYSDMVDQLFDGLIGFN
jgi:hypothetical protein